MGLEEIRARALAAGAETKRRQQEETERDQAEEVLRLAQEKETATGDEVKTHQEQRAALNEQFQQRMTQLGEKRQQVQARIENRQKELGEIEGIRQSIAATESDLSKFPGVIDELSHPDAGLSKEDLDATMQQLAEESQRLTEQWVTLQKDMESRQGKVEETDGVAAELDQEKQSVKVKDGERKGFSDHSPDLAAAQGQPLSPEAMDKIRDMADADNKDFKEQAKQEKLQELQVKLEEAEKNYRTAEDRHTMANLAGNLRQSSENLADAERHNYPRKDEYKNDVDHWTKAINELFPNSDVLRRINYYADNEKKFEEQRKKAYDEQSRVESQIRRLSE